MASSVKSPGCSNIFLFRVIEAAVLLFLTRRPICLWLFCLESLLPLGWSKPSSTQLHGFLWCSWWRQWDLGHWWHNWGAARDDRWSHRTKPWAGIKPHPLARCPALRWLSRPILGKIRASSPLNSPLKVQCRSNPSWSHMCESQLHNWQSYQPRWDLRPWLQPSLVWGIG